MKTDKNSVIGFVLLGILFFLYFWYTNKQQSALAEIKKKQDDSTALVQAARMKVIDTVTAKLDSVKRDSAYRVSAAGSFTTAATGVEQMTVVENELMKVNFSNKGGKVYNVVLKNYKSQDGNLVTLSGGKDQISYAVNTGTNQSAQTAELFFIANPVVKNADGSQTIRFTMQSANGESIVHEYIVRPNEYMIDWNLSLTGADKLLSQGQLNMQWNSTTEQQERTAVYE
ncbi:MAG: membrane protein insertase YidC, partial [Bacteroidetes bacterium]|nr:membrane protein insertase YidC [Bacteroidota bacterium]